MVEKDTKMDTIKIQQTKHNTPLHKPKNFFKVTTKDKNGKIIDEGHNAVLNSGRAFNSMKIAKTDIENETVYDFNGNILTNVTLSFVDIDCLNSSLFAFSCLGAVVSGTTEPIPTAIIPSNFFTTSNNLDVNTNSVVMDFPVPGIDGDGQPYGSNLAGRQIKEFSNIEKAVDGNGVQYTKITLSIKREEFIDRYWNEILIWCKVVESGVTFYVPYSAFAMNPLSNQAGSFSYQIEYGIYL